MVVLTMSGVARRPAGSGVVMFAAQRAEQDCSAGPNVMADLKDEIKARVERILSGRRRSDDLLKIVLWLRFQGNNSVKELGHFLAHFDAKDRGKPTEEMTNYFLYMRTFINSRDPNAVTPEHIIGVFQFDNMSADFKEGLTARLSNINNIEFAKKLGISQSKIKSILKGALNKAVEKTNGRYTLEDKCDEQEELILRNLLKGDGLRDILTGEKVFLEFVEALSSAGVIDRNDARISSMQEYYCLFVAVSLNKAKLFMSGVEADLYLMAMKGRIVVMARAIIHTSTAGGRIFHLAPMYWTDIASKDVMDKETEMVLSDPSLEHRSVEIDENGKLVML